MRHKIKSIAKGAALGAALIALASILWGCNAPFPKITVRGTYGDYSWSKGEIVIAPKPIIIFADK